MYPIKIEVYLKYILIKLDKSYKNCYLYIVPSLNQKAFRIYVPENKYVNIFNKNLLYFLFHISFKKNKKCEHHDFC